MLITVFMLLCQDPAILHSDGSHDIPALTDVRRAYAAGQDTDAIVACDRVLLGSGLERRLMAEVRFWRGAALRRLRRHAEALVSLEAASELGHAAPELHLERALALAALGRDAEAQDEMDSARRLLQEDPPALDAFERRWRSRGESPQRFELRVRPSIGYDSNIVAVDDDAALIGDPERSSLTYGLGFSARYVLLDQPGVRAALELAPLLRAYASEPDFSYADGTASASAIFAVSDIFDLAPRLAFAEAWLSEDGHFRTQRIAGLAGVLRPAPAWGIRLWAEFGDTDYYFDAPETEDRDGTHQQAGVGFSVGIDGWRVSPALTILRYDADGDDYDRTELQPGISVAAPPAGGFEFTLHLSYVRADYDEANSLAGFTEERRDRRWIAALAVRVLALEPSLGVAPTVTIRFEDWGSNLDAYEFDRWVPEVDFSFLAWSF